MKLPIMMAMQTTRNTRLLTVRPWPEWERTVAPLRPLGVAYAEVLVDDWAGLAMDPILLTVGAAGHGGRGEFAVSLVAQVRSAGARRGGRGGPGRAGPGVL